MIPIPTPFVVLHTGEAVTLGEYLFRVVIYVVAFAGLGVTALWSIRVIDAVRSAIGRRVERTDNES